MKNYKEDRPWGSFENLLEENYCKVKKIIINPNQRPSYQYHFKRSEHWVIVSGVAKVTIDDVESTKTAGEYVYIPEKASHRIENISSDLPLIFIEVQCGIYFGEDDIVRISDDYKR
jgi:mannose-6-phosphate isomerase